MGLAGWRSDQSLAHGAFQFNPQVPREDVHRHHDSQAQIPVFAEHPEEQVLGSDEAVVMAPCLVEGELDGLDETAVDRRGRRMPPGRLAPCERVPSRRAVVCRSALSSARWHTVETGMPASRTAAARSSGR